MGIWLLRAGIAAGLLFLAAGGSAHASDLSGPCDEATRLLLAPEPNGAAERAREAREMLAVDRNRKLAVISSALVELGINASVGASPVKILESAGNLSQSVLTWSDRTRGEERALLLLAPGALGGELDQTTRELYERLEGRERHALVRALLDDGGQALAADAVSRARVAARRALVLEPGSERADALLDAIESRERSDRARETFSLGAPKPSPTFAAWDVRVAMSLLTDADARAEKAAPSADSNADLARAATRYESGERAEGLAEFRVLAARDDHAGEVARTILEDRNVNPERALDDEITSYTERRALGWLGGEGLANRGLTLGAENVAFSADGYKQVKTSYRLLRNTVNPVNLVLDAPVRIWRGWRPDGSALRDAASRYLELEPAGARADDARTWLEKLRKDERASATVSPFRDGYFVLPHAHTHYAHIAPRRVVVSLEALEQQAPELAHELGLDASPAVILAGQDLGAGSTALEKGRGLELLARLADGLESGALQPRNQHAKDVLEAVRRLDAQIRSGVTLRAAPRTPDAAAGLSEVGTALVDGKSTHTIGEISLSRKDQNIVAGRALGGDGAFCLPETPCIDRRLPVAGALFAHTNAGGAAGIGARADYQAARLSVEMSTGGPHATLVLPIARWLGITRLLPVEAHVEVGLDGISAGPRLDSSAARAAENL
ncbi:MAG: hypothetical protein ACHQ6T_06615 [Myxococcota bacterium]